MPTGNGTKLKGGITFSVPSHFNMAPPERSKILETYYGKPEAHQALGPAGLLGRARQLGSIDFVEAGVRVLVLNCNLDPEDEILVPRDDFLK